METFFGPDNIQNWYLKRLGRVATARLNASGLHNIQAEFCPEVVVAALEFNANVSPEGISPSSDKKHVQNSLTPVIKLLSYLSHTRTDAANQGGQTSNVTPLQQQRSEEAASTLLQVSKQSQSTLDEDEK
mgnify:CR=1 FL=1